MSAERSIDLNDGTQLDPRGEREILISRSFAAPARIVFEAITRPEHVRLKEVGDQVVASGMEGGMRESYLQVTARIDALVRGLP
jgi:hypothetical protein